MSLIGVVIVMAPQRAADGPMGPSYRPAPAGEEYTSSCQSATLKIALRFESQDSKPTAKALSLSLSLPLHRANAFSNLFF